jgi:hypothetical protein
MCPLPCPSIPAEIKDMNNKKLLKSILILQCTVLNKFIHYARLEDLAGLFYL